MVERPTPNETSGEGFFNARTKLALGALVLVAALAYLIYTAFPGNAQYYLTISELAQQGDAAGTRTVRVAGTLVSDSFRRDAGDTVATFMLTDGQQTLRATYDGVVPDLFFNPYSEVVLEGRPGLDGVFLTDNVIVKCPSKYQKVEYEVPPEAKPGA